MLHVSVIKETVGKQYKLLLLIGMFVVHMVFLAGEYGSTSNLGFMQIRFDGLKGLDAEDLEIRGSTPWGSDLKFEKNRRGLWELEYPQKRNIKSIGVKFRDSRSVPLSGWEVSVSSNDTPNWRPVTVASEEGEFGFELGLLEPGKHISVFPVYRSTLNWLGDFRFLVLVFVKSWALIGVVFVTARVIIRALNWATRNHNDDKAGEPSRLLGSPLDRLIVCSAQLGVLIFALHGLWLSLATLWPGLHDDGAMYSTVILNKAKGLGNVYSAFLLDGDKGLHENRLDAHGHLYYKVMEYLRYSRGYEDLLGWMHLINTATFLVGLVVFSIVSRRVLRTSWLGAGCISIPAAFATLGSVYYLQGRPEHGIPLVLLGFAAVRWSVKSSVFADLLTGCQIGVVAAVSPLPGVVLCVSTVFLIWCEEHRVSRFRGTSCVGFAAFVTWVLCTWVSYDGNLIKLVATTVFNGNKIYKGWSLREFSVFWIELPLLPFAGVLFGISVLAGVYVGVRAMFRPKQTLEKVVIAVCAALLAQFIWKLGVAYAGFNYAFLSFVPSIGIFLLTGCSQGKWFALRADGHRSPLKTVLVGLFFACVFSLSGWGAFKSLGIQNAVLNRGVRLSDAREKMVELEKTLGDGEVILIDSYYNARSAIVFAGIPWRFLAMDPSRLSVLSEIERSRGFFGKYYVVLQYGGVPPERNGFRLISNEFVETPVSFLGKQVLWYTPGFGYAIYEREAL